MGFSPSPHNTPWNTEWYESHAGVIQISVGELQKPAPYAPWS